MRTELLSFKEDRKMKIKKILTAIIAIAISFSNTVFALSGVTSTVLTNYNKNSKADNVFKIAGDSQSFTLIGEKNGKYFVVANEDYGTQQFSVNGSQVFNPQEAGNIAYWLNNDFISEDYTGKRLPQQILDYIDYNHVWQTEPSGNGIEGEVKCGISLLSQTEFVTNIDILGIKDKMNVYGKTEDEFNFWWTRSPDSLNMTKVMSIGFLGNIWSDNPTNNRLIRPAFYLDKAFFENIKLDTSYMGTAVKNVLKSFDTESAGYSYSDLEIIEDNVNDFVYVDIDEQWSDSLYDKNYVIDKKISFNINFNNMSQRLRKASVYWQIGENKSQIEKVTINDSSKESKKIVLPINRDGRYDIKLFVSFDGENYAQYSYDINYVESIDAKSTDKGYNVSPFYGAEADDVLELLNATGVNTVRASGFWNEIETAKGKYIWNSIDAHMKKAKVSGVDTLYILGLYNSLYKTLDGNGKIVVMGSDEEIQAFVNYAKEVAKRYPEITKYEIWNEPNANNFWPEVPNIDNYKKLVKAVSTALKEINPNIEIIIGVTSNSSENTPTTDGSYWCINWKEYIASLMEDEELSEYFDAVSIHKYYINRTRADSQTAISDIVDIVRRGGGFKKIYMTEAGGYSGPKSYNKTEDEKAREMVRQFVIGDEYQLDGTWIYELVNSGTDALYPEHNYGVVSSEKADFRPLDAYYANKYYLSQIDKSVYLGKTALNENITAHLYSRDGKAFMIAWSNSEDMYEYTFSNEVCQYDLYGKLITESSTLSIGGSPVYIYEISDDYVNNIAKEFISTHIEALATDYECESFRNNAISMKTASNAEEVYDVMSEISVSASNLINSGSLTSNEARALLYDISRIYNRLSNYLAILPDAKEADFDDVKKAYEHYEATLEDLKASEGKGTSNIYQYGLSELENLSYDSDFVYNIPKQGDGYSLDKYGNLTITGNKEPGMIVNLKITNPEGSTVYVDSETADISGAYSFDYIIDGSFGEYTVNIGTTQSKENFSVTYENDEEYISFLQKKYYGKILKSEKLLHLSKDYLFKYSELVTGKNLLVDVTWDVNETEANARFTIKNKGNKINGKIFLVGYDEHGRLVKVANVALPIEIVEKQEFVFELNFEEKPANIQAFLWDSNTFQPLIKVREF